jgi:hypothetical protein
LSVATGEIELKIRQSLLKKAQVFIDVGKHLCQILLWQSSEATRAKCRNPSRREEAKIV